MNGLQRRLRSLEAAKLVPPPRPPSRARERMREHLDRVAAMRRGELEPEQAADVEAESDALRRRLAQSRGYRGEGGS
jgi:hypothetical protein